MVCERQCERRVLTGCLGGEAQGWWSERRNFSPQRCVGRLLLHTLVGGQHELPLIVTHSRVLQDGVVIRPITLCVKYYGHCCASGPTTFMPTSERGVVEISPLNSY